MRKKSTGEHVVNFTLISEKKNQISHHFRTFKWWESISLFPVNTLIQFLTCLIVCPSLKCTKKIAQSARTIKSRTIAIVRSLMMMMGSAAVVNYSTKDEFNDDNTPCSFFRGVTLYGIIQPLEKLLQEAFSKKITGYNLTHTFYIWRAAILMRAPHKYPPQTHFISNRNA